MRVAGLCEQLLLRGLQRLRLARLWVRGQLRVEVADDLGRSCIVHEPQRGEGRPRPGFDGDPGEPECRAVIARRRLAGAERQQLDWLIAELRGTDVAFEVVEREVLVE